MVALYEDALHLHRFATAHHGWDERTQTVQAWLDQWPAPTMELLRYVGVRCPHQIVTVYQGRRTERQAG